MQITFHDLRTRYLASEFLPALEGFVKDNYPRSPFLPRAIRFFNVYKQLRMQRPKNYFVSSENVFERI